MPWTKSNYPVSMKNLPDVVREKSIEIANALLEEKSMDEGFAIATAISRAKDWAANRGIDTQSKSEVSRSTDVKKHGEDRYVIPYKNKWAVKVEGNEQIEKVFDTKSDAMKQARKEAHYNNASVTIQKKDGKVEKRISFNPNNHLRRPKSWSDES